jgi:hypothetical protein
MSLILHSTLVAIHLALLGMWAKGVDNRLVFSLDHKNSISFAITAISLSQIAVPTHPSHPSFTLAHSP